MRNLNLYFMAALLFLSCSGVAQHKISLEPRLGYGTFRMRSMQELQQRIILSSGVNAKDTDTFGPYFQYGMNAIYTLNEHTLIGLLVEHGSTGGRVDYEDYSGELQYNSFINYNALGLLYYKEKPFNESRFKYLGGIEANVHLSKMQVESYLRLYTESDTKKDKYNSTGFGLKPYIGLQYPVLTMPLRITLSYLASVSGAFKEDGEPELYLLRNTEGEKQKPDWSGLRFNLSVSIPIIR